ncbi:MAG: hypothetical protein FJ244_01925 [Nitrospira sp.]|nr:hypothetical protein [Nitrospira sp.]
MMESELDKHQLAGFDDRERGFSRSVEFERAEDHYRANLRYEFVRVTTDPYPTQDHALTVLIQTLQRQGYRQLRTQKSYCNGIYLGSQELWVEYPDPQREEPVKGLLKTIMGWFRPERADANHP